MKGHVKARKGKYTILIRKGPWRWELHILALLNPRKEIIIGPEWYALKEQERYEQNEEKRNEEAAKGRKQAAQTKRQHTEAHGGSFATCKRPECVRAREGRS